MVRNDAGGETVSGGVGQLDGIIQIAHGKNGREWPKRFAHDHLGIARHIGNHGRLKERTFALTSDQDLRPGGNGFLDHLFEINCGRLIDNSSDASFGIERIAAAIFLCLLDEPRREFVENRFLNEDAFDGGATLTGVSERAFGGKVSGQIKIGVLEYDERIIAPEFEDKLFVASGFSDSFAYSN